MRNLQFISMNGVRAARLLLFASLLVLAACSDSDNDGAPAPDPLYPTVIPALSPDTLAVREASFSAANPTLCSHLDAYGYCTGTCTTAGSGVSIADSADVRDRVERMLVANASYTGVSERSALHLASSSWGSTARLTFGLQQIDGIPVEKSRIVVNVKGAGIRSISGHHVPAPHIPHALIDANEAEASLVGETFRWYNFGGDSDSAVATREMMPSDPVRVIYPLETAVGLELRVGWRVEVAVGPGYHVFIDTVTGETLETRPLGIS